MPKKTIHWTLEYTINPGAEKECDGCELCKVTDESFDHEFGTEHQEGFECQASDAQLKSECPAIDMVACDYSATDCIDITIR